MEPLSGNSPHPFYPNVLNNLAIAIAFSSQSVLSATYLLVGIKIAPAEMLGRGMTLDSYVYFEITGLVRK